MIEKDVSEVTAFDWIAQMRYYWRGGEGADGNVGVAMITTEIMFGMEYLGNYFRLVATPLTDRCFR